MESSLDFHKDLMIRQHLKELQAREPKLTFAQAWTQLQKQRPELFQSDEPGEVRQSHIKLGVQSTYAKVQSDDYISVRAEDIKQLERIEAALE